MRILAGLLSLGRTVFGIAFIANPKLMEDGWIGRQARLPGAQVLARAVGARDLTIGLGGLQALARNDGSARAWMAAGSVCDAVDFGATYSAGRGIPRRSRSFILLLAAGAAVLSAVAAAGLGDKGGSEPPDVGFGHDVTEAGAVPSEPVATP